MNHIFDESKLNNISGTIVNGFKYYTYYDVMNNYNGNIPSDCEYFHITNSINDVPSTLPLSFNNFKAFHCFGL